MKYFIISFLVAGMLLMFLYLIFYIINVSNENEIQSEMISKLEERIERLEK
jgi:hypothetical protein